MITFQELIFRLTKFWEKKGCVIHVGHDLETGAGTFNPATFLRCLGPEPYHTAYVEPSRRPSDSRFGENPNRLQLFHQFQVILKPSPPDVQALYLKSLEAVGFKLKEHDIRFVHDDWESPTLGAWGLGWEVWCDGMEVSQFTYFQGMASLPLKPVSAEITYGLERLCMYIQNVDNIMDIHWNETMTLGDISKQNEVEWSAYNFTEASTEMWLKHFEDFEKEAKRLIALHFPLPAYDFVIKASHAFNLLDARGVISTTERTGYIGRIRDLARLIAGEYVASREKLGFPLTHKMKLPKIKQPKKPSKKFDGSKKRDFLLEIGSEQLPATFVPIGQRNLERALKNLLEKEGLSFDSMTSYGTPRRICVKVEGLVEGAAPQTLDKRGPPVSMAFDSTGSWTPQGEGFLKSASLPASSLASIRDGRSNHLRIEKVKETEYLFATVKTAGKSTAQILADHLPALIDNLEFPKKMRWGTLDVSYARPIHWIVSLFGKEVIPFVFGDVLAGNFTFGHAQRSPGKIVIKSPDEYLPKLKDHKVLADVQERKASILSQIEKLEAKHKIQVLEVDRVLPQVVQLTEWPELTIASFDDSFLRAPKEVLSSEMVEHQKYFPVAERTHLKNQFIITCDNTPNNLIREGNQKVLSARLSDGVFLYEQDRKTPLRNFNGKLFHVIFQKDLGSMMDKVTRIRWIAPIINKQLESLDNSSEAEIADPHKVEKATDLCKADLVTALVKEFPELQGTIGKYYALADGIDSETATAIEEQWMPRTEGAPLPITPTGTILSLADKIDNLLAYYSVGLKPTSSSDPYALRRQTIGILRILIEGKYSIDLKKLLIECGSDFYYPHLQPSHIEEILTFITARAKGIFENKGFMKDEIDASLYSLCINPYDQLCQVEALNKFRNTTSFKSLLQVYKRVKGFLTNKCLTTFDLSLATEPSEKALHSFLVKHIYDKKNGLDVLLKKQDYKKAYALLKNFDLPLINLVANVKIMSDDPKLQNNRLALLQMVFDCFAPLLDFSLIQED
ncbi:MAG: glycine--tRNA ligase subunit beta [Rhabdochlamydiaceae bacterium]|nr:glycine--tRNA ligase subunit beta [Rhabdochlamydiaceae bacterium]